MVVVILVLVVRMRVVVVITGRPTGVQIGSVGSNGPAAAALQVLIDITLVLVGGGGRIVGAAHVRVPTLHHENLLHLPVVEVVQLADGRLRAVDQVEDDGGGARTGDE